MNIKIAILLALALAGAATAKSFPGFEGSQLNVLEWVPPTSPLVRLSGNSVDAITSTGILSVGPQVQYTPFGETVPTAFTDIPTKNGYFVLTANTLVTPSGTIVVIAIGSSDPVGRAPTQVFGFDLAANGSTVSLTWTADIGVVDANSIDIVSLVGPETAIAGTADGLVVINLDDGSHSPVEFPAGLNVTTITTNCAGGNKILATGTYAGGSDVAGVLVDPSDWSVSPLIHFPGAAAIGDCGVQTSWVIGVAADYSTALGFDLTGPGSWESPIGFETVQAAGAAPYAEDSDVLVILETSGTATGYDFATGKPMWSSHLSVTNTTQLFGFYSGHSLIAVDSATASQISAATGVATQLPYPGISNAYPANFNSPFVFGDASQLWLSWSSFGGSDNEAEGGIVSLTS